MPPLIIGIGNEMRGDDAVGLLVARALGLSETVLEHDGEPASLIALWEGQDEVVMVDAVTSGRPPGTVVEVDVIETELPAGLCHSTHALGPAEAVELARALGKLPTRMRLVGIEASDFSFETGLTPEVEEAVDQVVSHLQQVLANADPGPGHPV